MKIENTLRQGLSRKIRTITRIVLRYCVTSTLPPFINIENLLPTYRYRHFAENFDKILLNRDNGITVMSLFFYILKKSTLK